MVLPRAGGAKAVQLVVQIVLARLLAPETFGVLAILLVVVSVADAVARAVWGWRSYSVRIPPTKTTPQGFG